MGTPASIRRHPLHPMLVTLPIGLWVFSFACDLLYLIGAEPVWAVVAFYALAGGVLGALVAAVPGFIDFLALRSPDARRVAAAHMGLNLALVALVGLNLWLRWNTGATALPIALSALMVGMLGVSGWLGGHLVHVLGVTVLPGATTSGRELGAEAGRAPPVERSRPTPDRRTSA